MKKNNALIISAIGFNSHYGVGINGFYAFYNQREASFENKTISEIDPQGYLGIKGLKFLNSATKVYCNVAFQCIKNRDIEHFISENSDKVGLYDSSDLSNIGDGFLFDLMAKIEGPDYVSPMSAPNTIANASSSQMAIKAKIKGPNFTVCSGSCSSSQALDIASMHLHDNLIDFAIVGSTEIISKYQQSVRLGENRKNIKKFSDELGVALILEKEQSQVKVPHIFGRVVDIESGFQLKSENNSDVVQRVINYLLDRNPDLNGQVDAIIIGGGIHNINMDELAVKVKKNFRSDIGILCPELLWGSGDNAGGLTAILMAIGIFEKKITNAPSYLEGKMVSDFQILNTPIRTILIVNTDQTGYTIVSLITK